MLVSSLILVPPIGNGQGSSSKKKSKKKMTYQIAITFDELPVSNSFKEFSRDSINYNILAALKKHKVKAGGFVVGIRVEESFDLIGQWLNQGHRLGSQTFSYQDYNSTEINAFLKDIVSGSEILEPMLSGFGQKPRFFRFPYLHYGDNSEKKSRVNSFLDKYEIQVAHATVVVEDYLYNLQVEKADGKLDSTKFYSLMNEYINHVLDEIEIAQHLSQQLFGRNCRQILRLRANQLNSLYLDELLGAIKETGYSFITLDKALKDKVFQEPEGYIGLRGVSYLEMIVESDPDLIPAK